MTKLTMMDFGNIPEQPDTIDEPGVMRIGGERGKRFWLACKWVLALGMIAAVLVMLFVRFGTPTLWAVGLVGFMLGYMGIMGKWASRGDDRY